MRKRIFSVVGLHHALRSSAVERRELAAVARSFPQRREQ